MWSKKNDNCKNCKTTRYQHRSRGYCTRCYPLIYRIEKTRVWNLDDPSSLTYCPRSIRMVSDKFEQFKLGCLEQLEERLESIANREEYLNSNIEGLDIEYQLQRISRRAGARDRNLFHGNANYIDWNFNPKQKKILFSLLNKIEESIQWGGIDLLKAIRYTQK